MQTLLQDVQYCIRTLARAPGFTAIVVLTLALGIGANTAIFSFVDGVLLKPLPYRDPHQLVSVWEKPPQSERNGISTVNFLDWKNQNSVFSHIAAVTGGQQTLTGLAAPVRLRGSRVSAAYFEVFGVSAELGRTFSAEEDQPGKDRVVVLSNRIWENRFGSDRSLIGKTIGLGGEPYMVIGVLPAGSSFDRGFPDIWTPLAFKPQELTRNFHWLRAFARLKPGVSLETARAEMRSIAANIAREYPDSNKGWSVTIDRFEDRLVGNQLRQSLYVLMAAVGAILLIGCVNVANLLLARGSAREREIAIRTSMGASRWRLIRQFLTESLILSLVGGILGVLVGWGLMIGLQALMPPFMLPSEAAVSLDLRALGFTLGIALLTGLLFGTVPALSAAHTDLTGPLKEGGRGSSTGAGGKRLRAALVVSEMALAFILLTGAGLLIKSFFALQNVNAGFDSTNVVTAGLPIANTRFADPAQLAQYQNRVVASLEAIPGVKNVALTSALPLQGWGYGMNYLIAGRTVEDRAVRPVCFFKMVTPSYFPALGIRLVRGRSLSELDRKGSVPVTVISESFAKKEFKQENPVGKRILIQEIVPGKPQLGPEIPWEIVGVIADEKVGGLGDTQSSGMYVPLAQSPNFNTDIVIQASTDPNTLARSMDTQVHSIDKDQALPEIKTLERIKSESMSSERLRTLLLTIFAGIALLLSTIGIYGVVSYSVAQRTHEMGIRSALGASAGNLVRLVLSGGLVMSLIGLVIGVAGAFALTRTLSALLFETEPNDAPTMIVVGVLLTGVALLACWIPARRVTKIDPVDALRYE